MTSKEFAKLLGVAQSTVSRALSGNPMISQERRNFITMKAREVGFELNSQAQSLRTNRTGTVGVILPEHFRSMHQNLMLAQLYDSLQRELVANGFDVMTVYDYVPAQDESVLERMIKRRKLDGLVILRKDLRERERELIRERDFPCVILYNSFKAWPDIDGSLSDRRYAGILAGRHLGRFVDYRPSFLFLEEDREGSEIQYKGFCKGLAEQGGPLRKPSRLRCALSFSAAYDFAVKHKARFLAEKTALHTQNDLTALGILTALRDMGIPVPGQVQLIGCDDILLDTWIRPQLSTVRVNIDEIVGVSGKQLRERIAGNKLPPRTFVSKPTLILRDTTLPASWAEKNNSAL